MTKKYKPLLYLCNYPPCDLGGACIIMKQVFSRYDQRNLHVLCDERWLTDAQAKVSNGGLLPCKHESVQCRLKADLRPRRIFIKLRSFLNAFRSEQIFQRAKSIIESENIQALMVPLYNVEFALAGYRLHKLYNIPFYVWECDDWEGISSEALYVKPLVRKMHPLMLREADKAWMTSPKMIRSNEERFGVKGEFLFNFVDVKRFGVNISRTERTAPWKLVYTGAINEMFSQTLLRIARWINQGMVLDGREIELHLYTNCDTKDYVGCHVKSMGFAAHVKMPQILAGADALLVAVAFTGSEAIVRMTQTSLYTKTIEYLAASRPVLYVGPENTAEYDYFGSVLHSVLSPDKHDFQYGLAQCLGDTAYKTTLVQNGFNFVSSRHSFEVLERDILRVFEEG